MTRPAHILAAAALALGLSGDAEDKPPYDYRDALSDKQREIDACTEDIAAILAGRRTGKSYVAKPKLVHATSMHRGSVNPYFSITRQHAKMLHWKDIKRFSLATGLDPRINEADLTVDFEATGGGLLWLCGFDNIRELDKARGSGAAAAVVDECQLFPPGQLQYLLEEVLEPATADFFGAAWIWLMGTALPAKVGYWYEMTKRGPRSPDFAQIPVFRGTMLDNPFQPDPQGFLDKIKARHGWTDDTPQYRREYLAEHCEDPSELVFPVPKEAKLREMPTHNAAGYSLAGHLWRYCLGVDVGQEAPTALTLRAAHPHDPRVFTLKAEKYRHMLIGELATRIHAIKREHPDMVVVLDTGGMGKQHAAELDARHGIGIIPAEKRDRPSAVNTARDDLMSGREAFIEQDCGPLLDEMAVLTWKRFDDGRPPIPDPSGEDHDIDAWLYSGRYLRHYRHNESAARPKPKRGSLEEFEDLERRDEERAMREQSNRKTRERWDA